MTGSLSLTMPSDLEVVMTREFNAPRHLVFDALTKPEHIRRWWGLHEDTMTVCEVDLRVGGKWRYATQSPDGSEVAFSGVFREIIPPDRLVHTEGYEAMPGTEYVVTTTLTEVNGKTTLRSHLLYQAKEHRDGHVASGMEYGANESYDRLEGVLQKLQSPA